MFAIIKNGNIDCLLGYEPSIEEMNFDECIFIENYNADTSYKYENGEVVEILPSPVVEKSIEETKQEDISKYKEIEKEAISKRSEYITAELLPLGQFRELKLAKLEADRIDIENRYNEIMIQLVTKYGEGILNDLL